MRNWKKNILTAAIAALAGTGETCMNAARATTYNFNTTNLTLNGNQFGSAFGGGYQTASVGNGIATFTFDSNVDFQSGDTINVTGSSPLDIVSYNDIVIPTGVTINVSASGNYGVAGGGNGGGGGGGGTGGAGGAGGVDELPNPIGSPFSLSYALNGGNGGTGGAVYSNGSNGSPGASGYPSASGTIGAAGSIGASGQPGQPGSNSNVNLRGGAGGAGAGAGGFIGPDGAGGYAGAAGTQTVASHTHSTQGGEGGYGASGGSGQQGANGLSGIGSGNLGNGLTLTAGSGGAGGGGGQGGGGGGAGGLGGGGGGGGGGYGGIAAGGGNGGGGGGGGLGGAGGAGSAGGKGGKGGGGGGAIELYAYGRVSVAGDLSASGGTGIRGGVADSPSGGAAGTFGARGAGGQNSADSAAGGAGSYGGYGGAGGTGGYGGNGGSGGAGGAGAGGTIMLVGSVVNANGASINTSGGDGSLGTDGRFVIGTNSTAPTGATVTGAQQQIYTGPTEANNYVHEPAAPQTPLIADLAGGVAAPYGVLANLTASDPSVTGLMTNAPKNAMAAVLVNGTGLPGYSDTFPNYQWVFLVNLSGKALSGLSIGLGTTTYTQAVTQQYIFTGSQAGIFAIRNEYVNLAAGQIFAFLAPTADINSEFLTASATGANTLQFQPGYEVGNVGYLVADPSSVPEPGSLAIAIAGGSLLLLLKRRTRKEVK